MLKNTHTGNLSRSCSKCIIDYSIDTGHIINFKVIYKKTSCNNFLTKQKYSKISTKHLMEMGLLKIKALWNKMKRLLKPINQSSHELWTTLVFDPYPLQCIVRFWNVIFMNIVFHEYFALKTRNYNTFWLKAKCFHLMILLVKCKFLTKLWILKQL